MLFDLGGTLVHYFDWEQVPELLAQGTRQAVDLLQRRGIRRVPREPVSVDVSVGSRPDDHRVRPLEQRLLAAFGLGNPAADQGLLDELCRCFVDPVCRLAHRYDDSVPTLERLRREGYRLAIVTNTPWSCPATLWREEIARQGLGALVDAVVCCRDVGWCKPAPQVFLHAMEAVAARPEECLFVGDDLRCDVVGAEAVGIDAVLIDRDGRRPGASARVIHTLDELWQYL